MIKFNFRGIFKNIKKISLFGKTDCLNKHLFVKNFSTNSGKVDKSGDASEIIDTDVLIVGGGVPGLSFASALLKSGQFAPNSDSPDPRIILIDQPQKINPQDHIYKSGRIPDVRVVSLTPASVRFNKSLGLGEFVDERVMRYVKEMQIWENKGGSYVHMNSKETSGLESLFKIISNNNSWFNTPHVNTDYVCATVEINHLLNGFNKLVDKLNSEMNNKGIKIYNQVLDYENVEIDNTENYTHLKVNKGKQVFRTKLLVASDGAKSIIRNKLEIPTNGYEYNETGLVCTFRGNRSSDTAYQRFLHNGIFALLPMYDDLYSIVCSMPKNLNENLKNLDEKTFIEVVNRILHNPSESDLFSNKLDRLVSIPTTGGNFSSPPVMTELLSKRFEFNLQLLYASQSYNKNTAFIGDAAHVIHPMAGQGLNLGISESALLAHEIISGMQCGRRINDNRSLEAFSNKAQFNSKVMISTLEALKAIFAPTNYAFSEIRNLGLSFTNKLSPLKGIMMTAASGEIIQPKTFAWEKNL